MITSADNHRLKELRKLRSQSGRRRSGRFAAEGEDLIDAAAAAGIEALYGLSVPGECRDGFAEVEESLLRAASVLGSGTRVIGVYEQRWSVPQGPLCVYLHGVHDPGNVGTIVRAAQAFGAGSVALGPGCADPYGPKAVRASMGAIFTVPLARVETLDPLPGVLIALDPHAPQPLRGPLTGEATLLVGGEREGLPASVLGASAEHRSIPLTGGDSLNAAMAATVALYEATRVTDS